MKFRRAWQRKCGRKTLSTNIGPTGRNLLLSALRAWEARQGVHIVTQWEVMKRNREEGRRL